jgi:hypothetical protein
MKFQSWFRSRYRYLVHVGDLAQTVLVRYNYHSEVLETIVPITEEYVRFSIPLCGHSSAVSDHCQNEGIQEFNELAIILHVAPTFLLRKLKLLISRNTSCHRAAHIEFPSTSAWPRSNCVIPLTDGDDPGIQCLVEGTFKTGCDGVTEQKPDPCASGHRSFLIENPAPK